MMLLVVCATTRGAAAEPGKLSVGPQVGVTSESSFVDGLVRFSDGDTDFVSLEPQTGFLVGAQLGYRFQPKLTGVFGMSYGRADVRYIEKDNLRPDGSISTIRLQPGVMFTVLGGQGGKTEVAVGGGVTLARITITDVMWNGSRVDPTSTSLGLFGAAGVDVGVSKSTSLHAQLVLEVNRPSYGDLENGLARADNETASQVDHDMRSAILLVAGATFGL